MPAQTSTPDLSRALPPWVPASVRNYLAHTEAGLPIRALARASGCHASTILRQIRRVELRRDDPLVDAALRGLGARMTPPRSLTPDPMKKEISRMNAMTSGPSSADRVPMDHAALMRDAVRVLRRLVEKGAVLAVAADMEKAVVVRDTAGGPSTRTAVVDRHVAQTMALKNWIAAETTGRITRYAITPAGRTALTDMILQEQRSAGFAESQTPFADQHRRWGEKTVADTDTGRPRRMRYNLAESPLTALARRRDKSGKPFLSDDLVTAGERLREDFELAQMGPRVAQNWDRFLTGGGRGGFAPDSGIGDGPSTARARVAGALADLGPGLSDVVLRCCCYLEGLETAEQRMGWSARSGKIVLRIALMRLKRHYDETTGPGGPLIG
ncbi:DUF6456 domain-containing protein [Sulfitobacter sabulilitoris]|uniref:Helix-turn-helix domain-containing protein n=1 Tax=Sulfitobacter sabulilitoris TaxID=2562655 RepID=A0A5S3PLR2_9RHOB|nr:DUF6456 domain-containing protein [Sulfitobacter sabulilitoris]TMM54510.1 helix-turn-helix domain-containing protein [Sulfitobacter sabulilitoris]